MHASSLAAQQGYSLACDSGCNSGPHRLIWIIAMLCAFCLLTVGAVVGLTYATMYALKDTSVRLSRMAVAPGWHKMCANAVPRLSVAHTPIRPQPVQVSNGTMYVKGSTTDIVRTGSADFVTINGVMVARNSLNESAAAMTSSAALNQTAREGIIASNPQAVLRTANYMGTPYIFNSTLSILALMELNYLYIQGEGDVRRACRSKPHYTSVLCTWAL